MAEFLEEVYRGLVTFATTPNLLWPPLDPFIKGVFWKITGIALFKFHRREMVMRRQRDRKLCSVVLAQLSIIRHFLVNWIEK